MAVNQIPVSILTPWGALTLQLRQQYLGYRQQQAAIKTLGEAVLGKLAAMIDGSDYTRLEAQLNLQAGQGVLLFGQVNSVVGNFRDSDSVTTINAAIDQFDNWIG